MHNPESDLENETPKILCDFEIQMYHQTLAKRLDRVIVNKKKREPADLWTFRSSGKQSKTKRKWKLLRPFLRTKNIWNMKVTVIPIVISALETIPKVLVKRLEDFEIKEQEETTQTSALLISVRILRRVLKTWVDLSNLCSLKLQWETIS